jgi:Zn-dependent protease
MEFLVQLAIFLPAIIIALTFHEYAHGWVANKLGDPTAKANGRLTLNPIAHLDPMGTILLILMIRFFGWGFGWGKPMPVNEYNFKNPVIGSALCSLAGPMTNFVLALIGATIFNLVTITNPLIGAMLIYFVIINIVLMIFNLLPVPPLDGHKVVRAFLPGKLRYSWELLENYSPYILIATIFIIVSTGILGRVVFTVLEILIPQYQLYL